MTCLSELKATCFVSPAEKAREKVTMWRRWLSVLSVLPERMWMRWALRSTKTARTRQSCSMTWSRAKCSCIRISSTCCVVADVSRYWNGLRRITLREWAGKSACFPLSRVWTNTIINMVASGSDRQNCGFDKMRQRWSEEHNRRGRTMDSAIFSRMVEQRDAVNFHLSLYCRRDIKWGISEWYSLNLTNKRDSLLIPMDPEAMLRATTSK